MNEETIGYELDMIKKLSSENAVECSRCKPLMYEIINRLEIIERLRK